MKLAMMFTALLAVPICGAQSVPSPASPYDSYDNYSNQPPSRARDSAPALDERLYNVPYVEPYSAPYATPDAGYPNVPARQGERPPSELSKTNRPKPLTVKSEFEMFAEDAAGHSLTVYGRQLFDDVPTTFAPMDHIPVPADYVVGPGDELLIRVWGKVELRSNAIVDRNGQIFIPRVGALSVAGLRYEQLQGNIRAVVGKLYKDFDLSVTMGQLRSIQVFVLGSARQPGVYTVSSLSTLVNALFASGGPSATGSMRHIQVRRGEQVLTEFDIYDLLRHGDKSHDVRLLPGDVIYIPPAGPQAAILGSVNEPGIYELKSDSTTITSVLKEVAGLTNLASVDRALLERVEKHRRRQVDEFALDEAGLQRQLKDGDILRIFPISPRVDNAVILRGNVAQPGRYLWHEGMRVADLIPTRDTLLTRDYWNQQNFLANMLPPEAINPMDLNTQGMNSRYPDNFVRRPEAPMPQNDQDTQQYASLVPFAPPGGRDSRTQVSKESQIREYWDRPRPKIKAPARDVMDDIEDSSTEVNWEYAAIERRDETDLTTQVVAFNLGKAIDAPSSPDNQPLKPGDIVTIFSRKDVPLPQDKHAAFVRIGGEVNAPGVYRVHPGETLRELVARAGGLTPHSYLYASQFTRVSTRLAQEEELRISVAQMQRDLAGRYASASSLAPTNAAEQQAQYSAQQALLAQLTAVHPIGRIVLDMKPESASIEDIPPFPLEDGDTFNVPATLGTVQVAGAVYNENAFRYQNGRRLASYLKAAGGPTRQADAKRIFLIRADGTVISRQHESSTWRNSFENLRVLPGDSIVVPTKFKAAASFMQQLPFVTQILAQTATTGAVLATR